MSRVGSPLFLATRYDNFACYSIPQHRTGRCPPATLSVPNSGHSRAQLFWQRAVRYLSTRRKTWSASLTLISYQQSVHWGKACKHSTVHHPRNYQLDQTCSGKRPLLTFLLGTHMGVPCFTWPASTTTPITIGSRELKMNWGSIFNLHGNTAMCLQDDKKRYSVRVDVTFTVLPSPTLLGHSFIHSRSVTWRRIKQEKKLFSIVANSSPYLIFKNYREQ